jgi:hypothetical protein|tara:strand:- start:929 stop:1273 length:345 start_codon:yes stop_codon:yes gene_type:complete
MDKTAEINNRLIYMKKALSFHDEMPYDLLNKTLEQIDKIMGLVCGCVDNSQVIVAYDRCQLDDAIGKKSTDGMWQRCQDLIHNNDGAWSAMSDNCSEAEDDILDLIDEEEMNNA